MKTAPRDPITGERLTFDSPKLLVRDYDRKREPIERAPIPGSINVLRPDNGGQTSHAARLGKYGGGMRWSPAFREYIAPVLPGMTVAERTSCWQWWKVDYVHLGILRTFQGARDREAIAAILAIQRDGFDAEPVLQQYGFTLPALLRIARRIALHVRHTYKLHDVIRPEIQVWHAPAEEAQPMHTGEVAG